MKKNEKIEELRSESRLAWTKQSWKWRRSIDAPIRASLPTAESISLLMVVRTSGHVVE